MSAFVSTLAYYYCICIKRKPVINFSQGNNDKHYESCNILLTDYTQI
uniref:Uncharacterized protein n=1 Tax=Arundo donax TaxID=35708 RepID=A0A0A8ZS10_ARUDO